MEIKDFDYELPKKYIAQEPVFPRDHSKLMVISDSINHKKFYDIIDYLSPGDVLVINETKVTKARLIGKKTTGAKAVLIVEESKGNICKGILACKNPQKGNKLEFGKYSAEIIGVEEEHFILKFETDVEKIMEKIGELPTPPYIKKKLEKDSQYQTCYSKTKGSIAAPTAGLHFTPELLDKIKAKGIEIVKICLHVGFGTFMPVRDIERKTLHSEEYEISTEAAEKINNRKGKLIVVGTTTVRTLETAANIDGKVMAGKGKSELFIKPGYKFKTKINAMITNFHLPKSTLLMLVSAFIGREKILKAYNEAIKNKYRFYSLGDAMLLWKK